MRSVKLKDLYSRKGELARLRIALREAAPTRPVRRKPRDPGEADLLRRLMLLRWERWLAGGKIERLGPRRFRLRIGGPKASDLGGGK